MNFVLTMQHGYLPKLTWTIADIACESGYVPQCRILTAGFVND